MVRLSTYDDRSGGIQPGDGLGAYLQEVGSHELLNPSEEHLLLGNLIMARHRLRKAAIALRDKGVLPPGRDTAHQRVRSVAKVLKSDEAFSDACQDDLTVRTGERHTSV